MSKKNRFLRILHDIDPIVSIQCCVCCGESRRSFIVWLLECCAMESVVESNIFIEIVRLFKVYESCMAEIIYLINARVF